ADKTGGGPGRTTVTTVPADVVVFPAKSRATAVSVCEPAEAEVASQTMEYGEAVSSAPRFTPSSLNCTPATPPLSEAVADTATPIPLTLAPPAGAVREIVGATVSGGAVTPPLCSGWG